MSIFIGQKLLKSPWEIAGTIFGALCADVEVNKTRVLSPDFYFVPDRKCAVGGNEKNKIGN